MAMTKGRPAEAYVALRRDILGGDIAPGTKLAFAMLGDRYGVSVSVAREALQRLVEQGLVSSEPGQGFRVVEVTRDDLLELTSARCAIEAMVLAESVEHGDLDWESQVVAAHHTLYRTPVYTDGVVEPEWARVHGAFHMALLQACPNRRLVAITSSLRDSAELYRQWSIRLGEHERLQSASEHRALLDAVLERDAQRAVSLLVTHIQRTAKTLLEKTGSGPERPTGQLEGAPAS